MSNDPTQPTQSRIPSPHSDYVFNLAKLDLTLPEGITRQDTFTATSKLGAFSEGNLKGIGEAQDRRYFLSRAEEVAMVLGSPNPEETKRFVSRGACLKHSPEQVEAFLEKLHELNLEFGHWELRRAGVRSIGVAEIEGAREVIDYVALLNRLGYREEHVYVALLTRAACLDPKTSEEWPTVELANASRTIDQNPTAQRNLPIWQRFDTAGTIPCAETIRKITHRSMHDPDMYEPI